MTANLSSSVSLNDMKESYMIKTIVCIATSKHTKCLKTQ